MTEERRPDRFIYDDPEDIEVIERAPGPVVDTEVDHDPLEPLQGDDESPVGTALPS